MSYFLFSLLSLYSFSQPINDDKVNAILLTSLSNWCSTPLQYTNANATFDIVAGSCWQNNNGNGDLNVWFKFVAPATGEITITITTTSGGMKSQQMTLLDASNTEIACAVARNYFYGELYISQSGLTVGATYYIMVDSRLIDGAFTLCIDENINYDYKDGAVAIPSLVSTPYCSANEEYSNWSATADETAGTCWKDNGGTGNKNVWFSFIATATTNVNIKINTSGVGFTMSAQQIALFDVAGTELN